MSWETVKLGDVALINNQSIGRDFGYEDIRYIDISSVGTGVLNEVKTISLEKAPSRAKRIVHHGDVILSTVRPNRRSFLYIKNPDKNTIVSTGFAVLTANSDLDKRFLYYVINDQKVTDYLTNSAKGAAYPAVDTEIVSKIEFLKPSLPTQRKIASILSAYDDLIENNTRRIKILEEMAQSIYKEWFVNFRFPGYEKVKFVDSPIGKIPEGWKWVKVIDLYDTSSGGTPSRKKPEYYNNGIHCWLKTKELDDSFIFDTEEKITASALKNSSAKLFPKHTVIIALYGATIGKLGILATESSTNQACCGVIGKTSSFDYPYIFSFLFENREKIIDLRAGAAQQNISQELVKNLKLIKPTENVMNSYNSVVKPLYELIAVLKNKNKNLRKTRDLLLPKLMSGEVEV